MIKECFAVVFRLVLFLGRWGACASYRPGATSSGYSISQSIFLRDRSLGILCTMKGLAKRRECLNDYILPVLVPIFDLCLMPLIIVIFSYFHCSAPSNFPSIIMDQEVVGNSRKLLNTLDDSSDWFLPLKFRHSDEPTSRSLSVRNLNVISRYSHCTFTNSSPSY